MGIDLYLVCISKLIYTIESMKRRIYVASSMEKDSVCRKFRRTSFDENRILMIFK